MRGYIAGSATCFVFIFFFFYGLCFGLKTHASFLFATHIIGTPGENARPPVPRHYHNNMCTLGRNYGGAVSGGFRRAYNIWYALAADASPARTATRPPHHTAAGRADVARGVCVLAGDACPDRQQRWRHITTRQFRSGADHVHCVFAPSSRSSHCINIRIIYSASRRVVVRCSFSRTTL